METVLPFLIQICSGVIVCITLGIVSKSVDLGILGNILAGVIGGGVGGAVLGYVNPYMLYIEGSIGLPGSLFDVLFGSIAGAAVLLVVGSIRKRI